MSKRNKIIYWVFTAWLALGMTSTGIVQLIRTPEEVDLMTRLGYPVYFLIIIGVWKLLAAVAILVPKFPLVKEWAYAGMFFNMSGALFSHMVVGSVMVEYIPPILMLTLIFMSWYFRPASRTLVPFVSQNQVNPALA
jgi:hypothetical protein